jgi:hypothetical protein
VNQGLEALSRLPGVWRGREGATTLSVISSGFAELNQRLPGNGWPLGALTEICPKIPGSGEVSLVTPALAALTDNKADDAGWVAWISAPHLLYPPALAVGGIRLSRLLLAQAADSTDTLWGMEQALRSGSCRAVLGWADKTSERSLRRLQLAAESTDAWAVLYRPVSCLSQASPAALRLQLTTVADGLEIDVLKNRGGRPGRCRIAWETIVPDCTGRPHDSVNVGLHEFINKTNS